MKLITLTLIALLALSSKSSPDYKVCTDDSKIIVDDVFSIIEEFENHPYKPVPEVFTQLMGGIQKLLSECAHIEVDLTRYYSCVDDIVPIFPLVKQLIDDIRDNKTNEIIIDISRIGLELTTAITECMKHQDVALFF